MVDSVKQTVSDNVKRKMSTFVTDTVKMEKDWDFNAFGSKVLEEIKNGMPMFENDGAFGPLLEKILNADLEGEMDVHLTKESRRKDNRRNGKTD